MTENVHKGTERRRGFDTGYRDEAAGIVMVIEPPDNCADRAAWIAGYVAGRDARRDRDLMDEIEAMGAPREQ